jgi:hypothetical protein
MVSDHFAYWTYGQPYAGLPTGVYNIVAPIRFPVPIVTRRIMAGYYASQIAAMSDVRHPGNKEIVMTTTYGATASQCTVPAWGSSASGEDSLWVTTFCVAMPSVDRVDGQFGTLVVGNNSMSGASAFAIADQPWAASYTPDTTRSFTTGTGAMSIQRIGVGDYYVNLGTGSPQGSTYLVNSAYEGVVCGIGEWKNFGVRVRCFDQTGASVDAQYYVLQVAGGQYSKNPYGAVYPYAFAWADQRSATVPYTPNSSYARSSVGGTSTGPITVTRTSVGDYQVEFGGFGNPQEDTENVQLTPFGFTYATCTLLSVTNSAGGTSRVVRVQCRDQHGALTDSRFNVLVLRYE